MLMLDRRMHRRSPFRADLACLRFTHRDLAAFRQVHHRIEDDLVARLDAVMHFDVLAEVARDRSSADGRHRS